MSSRVDLSVEGSGYDASELNPSESASARLGGLSVGDGKNTVRELQKQLLAGQTALRKAKTLIEVLRGEKKTLKNQVVELQAKVTQCEGAIEATKMDALNIGSHLSHVQSTINAGEGSNYRLEGAGAAALFIPFRSVSLNSFLLHTMLTRTLSPHPPHTTLFS